MAYAVVEKRVKPLLKKPQLKNNFNPALYKKPRAFRVPWFVIFYRLVGKKNSFSIFHGINHPLICTFVAQIPSSKAPGNPN
jgi:hypothetical protein